MSICQNGVIKAISNGKIIIKITRHDACDTCRVKEYCHTSSSKEQLVEYQDDNNQFWHVGDKVELSINEKILLYSICWSYVLPLLLMVMGIFIAIRAGLSETLSGISGIIILIMYYFGLFLSHGFIDKKFTYKIKAIDKVREDND